MWEDGPEESIALLALPDRVKSWKTKLPWNRKAFNSPESEYWQQAMEARVVNLGTYVVRKRALHPQGVSAINK